jgi:NAD(P)-dependent dehydrogenase (short-subunit alcohol dehydrogenase family)
MRRLSQKIAIVTGAGSGIGRATAQLFAAEGAAVVLADRDQSTAIETQVLIGSDESVIMWLACDISQEDDVRRLALETTTRFGRIDILVNNAAAFHYKGAHEVDAQDWQKILATNVVGTSLCSRAVGERMRASGGGAIVNVASINGFQAEEGYATYCSSKAALLMLTRCMAIDFGRWNIRVNSVSPGPVNTPALQRELERLRVNPAEFERQVFQKQCLQRILQPMDVARTILFLASEDAAAITGTDLVVDGGYTARS